MVIESVEPEIEGGRFPIKRVTGEKVVVQADIFADGHDAVAAGLLYRRENEKGWQEALMTPLGNDRWEGRFTVSETGIYYYTLRGWVDHFQTWQEDLRKKYHAGYDVRVELRICIQYIEDAARAAGGRDGERLLEWSGGLKGEKEMAKVVTLIMNEELTSLMRRYQDKSAATTYDREFPVIVDREKALFSSWYELFPRSCSPEQGRHGTLKDCETLIPQIAEMGFDVLYLPPIHPIGRSGRKGKNNVTVSGQSDPGSPWAIGSEEGGHKSIHRLLGTMEDFERLIGKAEEQGMEVAMDIAFQCSPDHPYVKKHPQWFKWRPDGTVQHAENPPKKYEDILPINFETEDWRELWKELRDIVLFWIGKGVRIFRVDNPHTKPFAFWEWLIGGIKRDYPEVIFLSEAFTRPKVMYRLAKIGFTQSYTYFTWRNTKRELTEYLLELTQTQVREYFRPNFWPNTPDILPEHLQYDGRPAFMIRFALTATLSSNYGIYGPPFELCISGAMPGKEEYLDSEKYEVKHWDRNKPGHIKDYIARINRIRKDNPALQETNNLQFYDVDNDYILAYGKFTEDLSNIILVVVNIDPYHRHSGWVNLPVGNFGIEQDHPYMVHDLMNDEKYIWQGERNYVEIDPHLLPVHIFRVRKRLKREMDFDYFM